MQAVASASATTLPQGEHHRRTPSSIPPPSPHQNSSSASAPGGPGVRLPPVSIPREDFLPVSFNPERRQSINSDPFLHAFSATSDPSYLRRPSIDDPSSHFNGGYHGLNQGGSTLNSATGAGGRGAEPRGGEMLAVNRHQSPRINVSHAMPNNHPFDSHPNYQFGTSFGSAPPQQHSGPSEPHALPNPHQPPHPSFPGPTSTYRFGGPSPSSAGAPLDPPSYFDYSMRRHSLTNSQSPTRPANNAERGGGGGEASNHGTKRKSSGEDEGSSYNNGSYYPAQNQHRESYPPPSMASDAPPSSKRRTTSVAADKMNNLELNEAHRRESDNSTWEGRRDSDESYRSASSQQGYSMFHPAQNPSHPTPPPPPNQNHPPPQSQLPPHPPFMRPSNHPNYYDDQVGPRGSIARGMYEPEHQNFVRRPSIPGVSQMIQGQAPFYPPGQAPHSAPPTAQHPSSPGFGLPSVPRSSSGPTQPAVTISSAPHQNPHPPPPDIASRYPVGPPPQWPSNPSLPSSQGSRQGSAGSLLPDAGLKDSPYSRSPELRISHKLAERKRRKEMATLFDDLRESLPGDKGVKSSKWEILTKAVEFIDQLKAFNRDLQNDNTNLRHHLNLPQAQPPPHELRPSSTSTPHPLQPAPSSNNPVHFIDHAQPQHQQQPHPQHATSPRPHPSRTGSHASSHASSLSIDNGLPNRD
ncbi:hypothetical protein JCM16303_005577 [Sporobolomyces ruberrimus]